jgi:phosphatidylserine decarboxylase
MNDTNVIVNPADARFEGHGVVGDEPRFIAKHVEWKVSENRYESTYKDRFAGGVFMRATIGANDYHHVHASVSGIVLEAVVMLGQGAFNVVPKVSNNVKAAGSDFRGSIDTSGYQMAQARGRILLDSEIGLVAVLLIGMAQVDSVVITARPGQRLGKGNEISFFQFGGSDVVLMFGKRSQIVASAEANTHYNTGSED